MDLHRRKAELGTNAMIGIAFGLLAAAAFILIWTKTLPIIGKEVFPLP